MERLDDCWDGREDHEVFYQRMQRRRKAKAAVSKLQERNLWLFWAWIQVTSPSSDGHPFELGPPIY